MFFFGHEALCRTADGLADCLEMNEACLLACCLLLAAAAAARWFQCGRCSGWASCSLLFEDYAFHKRFFWCFLPLSHAYCKCEGFRKYLKRHIYVCVLEMCSYSGFLDGISFLAFSIIGTASTKLLTKRRFRNFRQASIYLI